VALKIRQKRCEIARAFKHWSGGLTQIHTHFLGQNMGEGCFTKSRWAKEQNMIERFVALASRLNENAQLLSDSSLPHVIIEGFGSKGALDGLFLRCLGLRGNQAGGT
jgi:hypothetical protein